MWMPTNLGDQERGPSDSILNLSGEPGKLGGDALALPFEVVLDVFAFRRRLAAAGMTWAQNRAAFAVKPIFPD